jgi:uncharacterized protein (TIGR03085 family)
MTPELDLRERHELCDLLEHLGPDAPTLCHGWTTADLAAHLVVRERRPQALPGIVLGGRLESTTRRAMAAELAGGYDRVIERIRTGPPTLLRFAPLRYAANLAEFTIHHEDVRRANGSRSRTDRLDLEYAIWTLLERLAPLMVTRARLRPVSLNLRAPGVGERQVGRGDRRVAITGQPIELLLYLYGRTEAAEVEILGRPNHVSSVRAASFSA